MIPREAWEAEVRSARDQGLAFFDLLTAVEVDGGFEVVLHLWDPERRTGQVLVTGCPHEDARVPSVTGLFKGAAWHERVVAELFGIAFDGHRTERLLLSAAFEGHPLRKDFVLAARVAKPWPGVKEPGESDADVAAKPRRRLRPPGVPDGWGRP